MNSCMRAHNMEAATKRVEAPAEREIRTVVPRENVLGVVFDDADADGRLRFKALALLPLESVLRIGDWAHR